MIAPFLQGESPSLVSLEEIRTGYSLAWILGYLALLSTCGLLVSSKLRREAALVRRYLFSQLGWAFLLSALLPRLAPMIWSPVVLTWLILGFLMLLEVARPQGRNKLGG